MSRPCSLPASMIALVLWVCAASAGQAQEHAPMLAAGAALMPDLSTPEETIHKHVDEVSLILTVTDGRGRMVRDLGLDDLQLRDRGNPPESIRSFQQQTDLPLRIGLLIDTSDSVSSRFQFEQKTASLFLDRVVRPGSDAGFVIGFSDQAQLAQDMTSQSALLSKGIHSLHPGGSTVLYDAIVYAGAKLQANEHGIQRRVIILITDGEDTASRSKMEDAIAAALRAETTIYALSPNVPVAYSQYERQGDRVLRQLCRATGGRVLPAESKGQILRAFHEIEQELRSHYALSYKPANFAADGSYHSIQVTVKKKHLHAHHRQGYFADDSGSF